MKPSRYNMYIPLEDGSYILFNSLGGALLTVDKTTKDIIDTISEKWKEVPEEKLNVLTQNGIVLHDNDDELLRIRYRYNEVRYNPHLITFMVVPTARCNLSCRYCFQKIDESRAEKNPHLATMSDSTVENVLCFIKNMTETCNANLAPVCFHGGEPLLAKNIILHMLKDLAQWCTEHSLDLSTSFYTNCTLFDQPFLDNLEGYTIDFVQTTLEGPEEIHDQFRHYKNGKGTYEDIVANMGMLLDAGVKVRAHININRYYERVLEMLDDFVERGLKDLIIEPFPLFDPLSTIPEVQKHYGVLDENFPVSESEYSVPFKETMEVRTHLYSAAFERGFQLPTSPLGVWTPCDGARAYHFAVGPAGEVYKCQGCILIDNLRVGQIHENGYFERYPLFYKWMDIDPTRMEECQSCYHLPSCGGGCIAARYLGNIPHFCEVSSFLGEEYLKMSVKRKYPELSQSLRIG